MGAQATHISMVPGGPGTSTWTQAVVQATNIYMSSSDNMVLHISLDPSYIRATCSHMPSEYHGTW